MTSPTTIRPFVSIILLLGLSATNISSFSCSTSFITSTSTSTSKVARSRCNNACHRHHPTSSSTSLSYSATDLLYEDQQKAKARRAEHEAEILGNPTNIKSLKASKLKAAPVKRGSGFGAGKQDLRSPAQRLAARQSKDINKDGVIRIDNALSSEVCDRLRAHVLRQQELADIETAENVQLSEDYYGVENRRKNRCDLLLSLAASSNNNNNNENDEKEGDNNNGGLDHTVILDTLQETLGASGTLRPIYEELVTNDGEFYEFAGIITNPGSDRQQIHPDLPHRAEAPLYVIFLALQDVSLPMGPTTFLLGSQTREERIKFEGTPESKDEQLQNSKPRYALLNKGDCVLFDARILHCGNANVDFENEDATRAMFNFSFRNPKETGDLGYCGSMRPGYVGRMSLGYVGMELEKYERGEPAFVKYGDGLSY